MGMESVSDFEASVLGELLRGNHDALECLRAQSEHLRVTSREYSGVGVFVHFVCAHEVKSLQRPRVARFGDVIADIPGLTHGAGFVLFVDEGRISMLEGYTYGEPWPTELKGATFRYMAAERDMSWLMRG
jgi:hypothetical protein